MSFRVFIALCLLFTATTSASADMACSLDLRDYLGADLVVVGRVVGRAEHEISGQFPASSVDLRIDWVVRSRFEYPTARDLDSFRVWLVHASTECCDYKFKREETYLVSANVSPVTGWLEISPCGVFSSDRFWQYAVRLPEQITFDMVDSWFSPGHASPGNTDTIWNAFDKRLQECVRAYFDGEPLVVEPLSPDKEWDGTSVPDFYAWVGRDGGGKREGAVKVRVIDNQTRMEVVDFLSVDQIRANPSLVGAVFPGELISEICARAGAGAP